MASKRSVDFVREGYRWYGTDRSTGFALMIGPRGVIEYWATSVDRQEGAPREDGGVNVMFGKTRWFRYIRDV